MAFDDFDLRHQETLDLIGRKETQATPVEQNFMEASGALDVMTPDQVGVNPQNLKRSVERAMRMSPNPNAQKAVQERGFPVPDQVDLGGGTVPVPPAAPKMTGETLSFVKGMGEPKKANPAPTTRTVKRGPDQVSEEWDGTKWVEVGKSPITATGKEEVPPKVKQAQALVTSIMRQVNPRMDPYLAMAYADNPQMLEKMKGSIPAELKASYDSALGIIKGYFVDPNAPEPDAAPDPADPLGYFKGK